MHWQELIDFYVLIFTMRIIGTNPLEAVCEIDKAYALGYIKA